MLNEQNVRKCSHCKEFQALDKFYINKRGYISSWCLLCRNRLETERRRKNGIVAKKKSFLTETQKLCTKCDTLKDFFNFFPATRSLGNLSAHCKSCTYKRPKNLEKARMLSKKYREKHRARYLALHRINQFNRKTKIKAVSDGTVTDQFIKNIYLLQVCEYCKMIVLEKNRTADHVVPLNRGGLHSASNIVMACNTCNSTKRDMLKEEFLHYLSNRRLIQ